MDFIKGFKSGNWLSKAKEYLIKPDKMKILLSTVLRYERKDGLKNVKEDIVLLYHVLSDVFNGTYKDYDKSTVVLLIAVLLYLVAPADLVPDIAPFVGLVDDAAVVTWALNEVKAELDKYKHKL